MAHEFDKDYWESHWDGAAGRSGRDVAVNPHLVREVGGLVPGTALEAGCGEGAEALWLAAAGWQVTAADISAEALARAAERASASGTPTSVEWVEADLGVWGPARHFDLVTTLYAHPAMPQLEFYDRLAGWVAPGGTLLVVGHLAAPDGASHGHGDDHGDDHGGSQPPPEVSVTASTIAARLDPARWDVVTAEERVRRVADRGDRPVELHDVVVRATRRP